LNIAGRVAFLTLFSGYQLPFAIVATHPFGAFEVDLKTGEVRKHGMKIRLPEQSFQILSMLLEQPGSVVTRDQLRERLWPANTFVDFDHSLSAAINKLRTALGDSAENPRFVETLSRRGYRFIAPLISQGERAVVGSVPASANSPRSPQRQWTLQRRTLTSGAALVVLAGAAAFGVWFGRSRVPVPETPLTSIPLTSYSGVQSAPSFSPDGNQVAFCWDGNKQDNTDIYVKLVGAGTPLRLTRNPEEDCWPAWSPDGRSIAFLRREYTHALATPQFPARRAAVMLITALGGPERRLAEIPDSSSPPAWSPDGKWLVIVDKDSAAEPDALFLLSIESGEKRRLTSPPARSGDREPAFSPDGRTLVFVRAATVGPVFPSQFSDVYVLSLSPNLTPLGAPRRLTFDNRNTFGITWTATGREIVVSSGTFFNQDLWRVATDGSSRPRRLALLGQSSAYPAISRQGNRLVYAQWSFDENIWRVGLPSAHHKGTTPRLKGAPFITSTRLDSSPQVSPDGKKIAFQSGRSSRIGSYEVWVCDSDGSNALQLTSLGEAGTPRWSPDSQRIAFDSNAEGHWEVYVIHANGDRPRRLTHSAYNSDAPNWSQDGKWIYFASNRDGREQLWKVPEQGGEPIQVTRNGGTSGFESLDGKFIYYAKGRYGTSLWKIPTNGGDETQVLESLASFNAFAVVDAGIYFIPTSAAGSAFSSIDFLSFADGKISSVATTGRTDGGLTVSPDGRSILYTQLDQYASELMLVENFR
jgi:Tol biopolymer transport system component/DNA-binding winged helix-turn-helix (wHTH) protein